MSFLDGFLASSPDDPRYGANMAFFGNLAAGKGIGAAGMAYSDNLQQAKAHALQQRLTELQLRKGSLEVSDLERKVADEQSTRDVLAQFARGQAGQGGLPQQPSALPSAPASVAGDGMGPPAPPQNPGAMQPSAAAPAASGTAPQAGQRNNVWQLYQRMGDALAAKGLPAAQTYYQLADKFRPKYGTEPRVMTDPATGKLVHVLVSEDGTTNVLPFGVKPNMKMQDLGGRVLAVDENTVNNGQQFAKTITPGESANLAQSERHFQVTQAAPQYMQTDAGVVALPKRPGAGPIVGQPVMGADGQPLTQPLKPIPPSVNGAIIQNTQAMNQVDRALALVGGQDIGDPAHGGQQGDQNATGFKGYLPQAMLNRIDPRGVDARAEVSDIGSLKIHDRSGAAVTVSESPRLMPFIPVATDDRVTVIKKLQRLRTEIANEAQALQQTYSRDQGYRPSPVQPASIGGFRVLGREQ